VDKVDRRIEEANQKLNRVKIWRRDRKLTLRGTLPPKPGERGNRQRTIALGIYANPDGVKVALARAQKLESDLNLERFNWSDWDGPGGAPGGKTAKDWGSALGELKRGTIQGSSYQADYVEPLGLLPDKPLSEDLLIALILAQSKANSRKRKS
jgi:hypothetical protein